MIKQALFFTQPASLSLKYEQLVIARDNEPTVTRPIENIGVLIIENPGVHLTIPLLNALTDNKVSVVICGANGMPKSLLMPLDANNIVQEIVQLQINASVPTKKRLWKEIVECKIRNQASLLSKIGKDGDVLRPYYMNVLSGDSDNREGVAARVYWQSLMGDGFVRDRDGVMPNALFNYGYAILRAATARAIVGSGMMPLFGLFHRNRYNAFPLADDIMEPYRPFVDSLVYEIIHENPDAILDRNTKQRLIRQLFMDVCMDGQTHPLQLSLTSTTASLVKALKDSKQKIRYPTFV